MQNTLTFLNKFFWWIIALLGVMLFIWWLVFSPLLEQAQASIAGISTSSSSSSSAASTTSNSSSSTSVSKSSSSSMSSSMSTATTSSSASSQSTSSSAVSPATNLIPTTQKGKYVKTFINGDDGYTGVNFRTTPCGQKAGETKAWNVKGTVNLAPATNDKCELGKYTWYFVEFEDNTKGWVVENNLAFSTTK